MFKIVTTLDDLIKTFIVRGIVFIEEQNVPYDMEVDEFEHSALHILGELDGEPIAAGRIRFLGKYAKLERIVVRKKHRSMGYGHRLVEYMMEVARENGFHKFKMHAQAHLVDFYTRHGFEPHGDIFDEAGIPHYLMVNEGSPVRENM